jgi:signal transduction histidine kinase
VSRIHDRKYTANLIAESKAKILESWETLARSEVPAAEQQPEIKLRDSVPRILDQLVKTLECEILDSEREENAEAAREHGIDRAIQPEYTLDEMIHEYHLLRRALFSTLQAVGPFDSETWQVLHDFMDRGVRKATIEYVKYETEKQKLQFEQMDSLRERLSSTIQVLEKNKNALEENVKSLKNEREMRERFVATLTHDLRTPLTSAKMGAQLIERKSDNAELVKSLSHRIVTSMDRADQMIIDLLDANRIKVGEGILLHIESCDLEKITDACVKELSGIYGARFEIKNLSGPIVGHWDRSGIERIIENLASNAVKYGENDTPVTIQISKGKDQIKICVHNHGNPIDEKNLDRIFNPYERLETDLPKAQIGWGVGLTLVKGIAEEHGGSVSVQSSEVTGTTFSVKLPLDARVPA